MKNKVVYEDLYSFQFLSDVRLSPSGRRAIFTKTAADRDKNGYRSELWSLCPETGETRALTTGGGERGGFWLDEDTVVFSANREPKKEEDEETTRFYKISALGGEAEKFLEVPFRVTKLLPLSDGRFAVLVNRSIGAQPEKRENRAREGADLQVFDEIPFWFNGRGVINKRRSAAAIYDSRTGELQTITPPEMETADIQLNADKTLLAFAGCIFQNACPRAEGLFLYDLRTGETKCVLPQGDFAVYGFHFLGQELFYAACGFRFNGENPRCFVYNLASGETRPLPFFDAGVSGSIGTDCSYGGGIHMKEQGGKLYFQQVRFGDAHLMELSPAGELRQVTKQSGSVNCFDMAGGRTLLCAMRNCAPAEIFSLDTETGEEKQLTHFNTPYCESHEIRKPERFTYQSKNGYLMEGWVIPPVGYEQGKKYPAVFEMHGGPKVAFGGVFHHEMQCFASAGYFVFYTNPRGSDGRGEDFANITENLGGIDFDDFMEFADEVTARCPDIDSARIGICGGSYGGFMCNWMIGHTNRFAAAASQRSISNYLSKIFCTDNGYNYNLSQLGADPWQSFETVWGHSPLRYAENAKTPTLFIQSDQDYRCWMSDAVQMFTALKMNGTDARMVLFHGENHELSRSGKPENRLTRLREIGGWFARYLRPES